jgi:hypothetical protein
MAVINLACIPSRFFVELGADDRRVHDHAGLHQQTLLVEQLAHLRKIAFGRSCRSNECRTRKIVDSSGTWSSPNSTPTDRRIDSES